MVVAAALLLRLGLGGLGWPTLNSDEATVGLMADDILWHGARPVFFYGQAYMGALQAYLAAPLFALFGPTNFALHLTTTLEFGLFLVALYAFTRAVYSWQVAWITIALLALGPGEALFLELRAGAGTQDTLLFGALLFWLAYLRLRGPSRATTRAALDAGIGVVAGLGIWGDVLILPLAAAVGLALAIDALRRLRGLARPRAARELAARLVTMGLGFGLGCAPFIAANVASRGATFAQVLGIAGVGAARHATGPMDHIVALVGQVVATLLAGLPRTLGSATICANCPVWPGPRSTGSVADVLREIVVSLPFSLVALGVWAAAALPLVRDVRRAPSPSGDPVAYPTYDARWWGRAMLVMGAAFTVLAYMASGTSYSIAGIERYLVGIYLCAPLLADPLYRGASVVWRWTAALARGERQAVRPRWRACLAAALLIVAAGLGLGGSVDAGRQAADTRSHGVPAPRRDLRVIAFLRAHGATTFYTTYWVCDRLMFEAAKGVQCAVVRDGDPFASGLNRVAGAWSAARASAHPGYVFDAELQGGLPAAARRVAVSVSAGDRGLVDYVHATVDGYEVYYYAGSQ
jgi:hypothetical protein